MLYFTNIGYKVDSVNCLKLTHPFPRNDYSPEGFDILERMKIILRRITITLRRVSDILERMKIILRRITITLRRVSDILKRMKIILPSIKIPLRR